MNDSAPAGASKSRLVTAVLLILIGLGLLIGGGYLAWLGGSFYYLIAGALVIEAGALLWRASPWGERLYALMLAGTLVWSVYEAGGNPWALMARLLAPAVLGIWLAMPWIRRDVEGRGKRSEALVISILILVVIVFRFMQFAPEVAWISRVSAPDVPHAPFTDSDWPNYGNTPGGLRFSELSQIDASNVGTLKLAWVHRSGLNPGPFEPSEATPLKVGDLVYTCTQHAEVIAIDAKTGQERWRYDPKADPTGHKSRICRGVSYHHQPDATGACAARILVAGLDDKLHALDAMDGKPCAGFGQNGEVSLLTDMGEVLPGYYLPTAPPSVVGNHVILGAEVADDQAVDEPSGVIRSYDAVTGALQWAWDMGAPDRIGPPPAGESYTRSTPNSWAALAADEKLGLVYVGTGNPTPDFYGIFRRPFDEKYGSALVALDVNNGRPKWSFQTTHHDLWDYDIPAQPVLVDVPEGTGMTPAVIQSTKRGELFVLDRRDGRPIVRVEERPVPQALAESAVPGEHLSATQPFSGLSLVPPPLTEANMWGVTPLDMLVCRIQFKASRYEGIFTPPGVLKPTISYPGSMGVADWGGIAVDDDTKTLVVNTSDLPWRAWLTPRAEETDKDPVWPQRGTPYVAHNWPFLGPFKVPCTEPPWGYLEAIDLKTNHILWRRILGTARDSGPFGIPFGLPVPIGVPSMGGAITTRSGLIFVAGTLDNYLRAFDIKTGKELWRGRLPAGGQATPMTYMAGSKQYVVITAGGHYFLGTKQGDYTLAFTLP